MLNINLKAAALTGLLATICAIAAPSPLEARAVTVAFPGQKHKECHEWRVIGRGSPVGTTGRGEPCGALKQSIRTGNHPWLFNWKKDDAKLKQAQFISEPKDCQLEMFSEVDVTIDKEEILKFIDEASDFCGNARTNTKDSPEGWWYQQCAPQAGGKEKCSTVIKVFPSLIQPM